MTSSTLAEPLTLPCGQVLPNRLMKSALSENLSGPGAAPSRRLERLYRAWAAGGWGLVVTGNVMVDRGQLGEPGNVVVEDERHLEQLTAWAAGFRALSQGTGADGTRTPLWMQVNHPGRQAFAHVNRHRPVAPSAVAARIPGAVTPLELTDAQIRDLVARWARTSAVAEAAGFDGIQVHGAHGYLVTQFLSPLANTRDDAWGGDPARRRRFVLEVVRAVRAAVSPGFAVGIKLNSADFQRGGFSEEESRDVVRALVNEGVDLLEISGGTYETPAMVGHGGAPDGSGRPAGHEPVRASTRAREAYFLEYAASVRELSGAVPVAVTGGFRSRTGMEAALDSGDCAVVGLGRPACVWPDAAARLLDGRTDRLGDTGARVERGRGLVARVTDVRTLDGALDLGWHTQQLHRIAAGKQADPDRSWVRTALAMAAAYGPGAFTPRRG